MHYPGLQYRLTETKAPDGYNLLDGTAFEGELASDNMSVSLRVVNTRTYTLPKTGSTGLRLFPVFALIPAFLNPETNPNHAQLVFTTHDSWQLSNNLLRRDEIWFTEKEHSGVSTLYSLADFVDEDGAKIRKDESYEKNYLLGKYGAIPTLKYFDMFKGE